MQLEKTTSAGFLLQSSLSWLQVGFHGLQDFNFGKRMIAEKRPCNDAHI